METRAAIQSSVQVEKPSSVLRKMTIRVPAEEVKSHLNRGLAQVQKTAKLKGFRPGHAPLSVIKAHYGEDVRHEVFHKLIEQTFDQAVREHKLKAVGRPQIDTPDHKTGEGSHDHTLHEDQDLTFTATFEIMPEVQVKDYSGISVSQDKVDVTDQDVQQVVDSLHQSQAQLVPASGGLVLEDGTQSSRPVQKVDFVDVKFTGGLVTDSGVQAREEMAGTRLIEVGAGGFIPGFEEQLEGMRAGETKTFRLTFPTEESQGEFSGKEAEFTVTVNEVKEKKLPTLDDEFVKQMGYESLEDLRTKAREFLTRKKTEDSDRKVKNDLLTHLIEKNSFEVPQVLIERQAWVLAQDLREEFKKQGYEEQAIQNAIAQGMDQLRKRAEGQIRANLILESIVQQEKISITSEAIEDRITAEAQAMEVERSRLEEYYAKNPGTRDELEFRLRHELALKFLLDNAKVKWVSAKEK